MNKALEKAREKRQEMIDNGEPSEMLNHWQKWQKKDTRLTAIKAFCWHCMGGTADYSEGVRSSVRDCTASPASSQPCPLFNWRPYK